MHRRAFLLGAVAAPVLAKAVPAVIDTGPVPSVFESFERLQASGGHIFGKSFSLVGENGAEFVIPNSRIVMNDRFLGGGRPITIRLSGNPTREARV